MKLIRSISPTIAVLLCAMVGGCSVESRLTLAADNTRLNRSRMTKTVDRFARKNEMQKGRECPREILGFVWTQYADFSDRSHPEIKLRVDVFDGELSTWLSEEMRFCCKQSERFDYLQETLRADFQREFRNNGKIETEQWFRFCGILLANDSRHR
jgi:hypothetical protein